MVSHTRFQQYKHHYGMVFLTGLLGCRWHRYQQSTDGTKKVDAAWLSALVVVSAFVLFWFYFWLVAGNSADNINWFLFEKLGVWLRAYTICFALTCVALGYVALVSVLALCHVGHGHQVYLHPVHRALLVLSLACCTAMAVVITDFWREGWHLQLRSLMITAPFLHVGGVALLTFLSWFVAGKLIELHSKGPKALGIALYLALLGGLYVVPLFVRSPCVCLPSQLPNRPKLVGHRGAGAFAPENTLASFERAAANNQVLTLESDVTISMDGVPFMMHDDTLRRTTNVDSVFPERAYDNAATFNISELMRLDAGSWFLDRDPYSTTSQLTPEEKAVFKNQTVLTLADYLAVAKKHSKNVMFDIKFDDRNVPGHPYAKTYGQVIMQTIQDSGIEPSKVWWLLGNPSFNRSHNYSLIGQFYTMPHDLDQIVKNGSVKRANIQYTTASWGNVKTFHRKNLSTNVYSINAPWSFSLYWCMGVTTITTDFTDSFSQMKNPVWNLEPAEFRVMWITTDALSFIIVVAIFIIQGIRHSHRGAEAMTLQTARLKVSQRKQQRTMKIKLIHAAEGLQEDSDAPTDTHIPSQLPPHLHYHLDNGSLSGSSTQRMSGISTGSDVTAGDSSLNRTLSEDEEKGIKMAEIKLEA